MSFARPDAGGQTDSAAIPGGDAVAIPGADGPAVSPPTEGGREVEPGSGAGVESAAADRVEGSAPADPAVTEPSQTEPQQTEPQQTEPPVGPAVAEPPADPAVTEPAETVESAPAETGAMPEILPWPDTDPWPPKVSSPETTTPLQIEASAETPMAPEILPWPDTDPWPPTMQKPETEASADIVPPQTVASAETPMAPEILPWPDTDPWPPNTEARTETVPTPEILPWPDTDPWPQTPPPETTPQLPEAVGSPERVPPPEILPWPDTDPWPQTPPPEAEASANTVEAPDTVPPPEIVPWPPTMQKPETAPPPDAVASPPDTVARTGAVPTPEIVPWPATDPWPRTASPTEPPPSAETLPPPEIVPWPANTVEVLDTVPPPEIVPWPATDPWPQTRSLAVTVAAPETDRSPETGPPPEAPPAVPPARGLPLRPGPCLARLDDGIAAAAALGLAVDDAEATRTEADERLGVSSDVCVVALIGGTGVGKSTLLNALAGTEVSAASARRPTTGQPVAWIPGAARDEMAPLLDWLGVDAIVDHADPRLASVAILDLPDLDSVDRSHRERVEELLPRVDAVIWVSDPEKYRDAVLHEDFLVRWLPRLDRQIVVLNKSDRLGAGDLEPVRAHFERSLRSDMVDGPGSPSVVAVAAKRGEIEPVRDWVNAQVDAKRVVLGRISASVVDGLEQLARQAGVNPDVQARPLLDPGDRKRSIDAATNQVLRLVDLPAATRQAVAATRAAARPRGAGPLGKLIGRLYRTSGRESRVADPERFLRSWTDRGSLAPALDALRSAVDEPLRTAPPAIKPAIAASVDGNRQAMRLRGGVDAAITAPGPLVAPTSRLWPVLGLIQTLATGAVAVAAVWLVLVVLLRPPVDVVALPIVGRVPAPLALLVGALIAAFVVARVLAVHAGWLGRQWADSVAAAIRAAVERAVADEAFAPLDRVDTARRSLWLAARGARDACARR